MLASMSLSTELYWAFDLFLNLSHFSVTGQTCDSRVHTIFWLFVTKTSVESLRGSDFALRTNVSLSLGEFEIAAASVFSSHFFLIPSSRVLSFPFFLKHSFCLSLPNLPIPIFSISSSFSPDFSYCPFLFSLHLLPPTLTFSLCRQTVKVKSNPILMKSNCMKMCCAGTEKKEQSEVKRRWERKSMDVCLGDREWDSRWEKEREDEGSGETWWVMWEQVWERVNKKKMK